MHIHAHYCTLRLICYDPHFLFFSNDNYLVPLFLLSLLTVDVFHQKKRVWKGHRLFIPVQSLSTTRAVSFMNRIDLGGWIDLNLASLFRSFYCFLLLYFARRSIVSVFVRKCGNFTFFHHFHIPSYTYPTRDGCGWKDIKRCNCCFIFISFRLHSVLIVP
jgi:hypothetical protein